MGNCCSCQDWGMGLIQKEEEPPTAAPSLHSKKENTPHSRITKATFSAVSPDSIRVLAGSSEEEGIRKRTNGNGESQRLTLKQSLQQSIIQTPRRNAEERGEGSRREAYSVVQEEDEDEKIGSILSLGDGWHKSIASTARDSTDEEEEEEDAGRLNGQSQGRDDSGFYSGWDRQADSDRNGHETDENGWRRSKIETFTNDEEEKDQGAGFAGHAPFSVDTTRDAASRDEPEPEPPQLPSRAQSLSFRRHREPSTLHVPSEEYGSIAAAMSAAISGDIISIAEGTYNESINIAAVDVDIIGAGDRDKTIVESTSRPVLSFRAMKGTVRNLTLRQVGGGCECAVDISAGAMQLEGCDLSCHSDAVIMVRGPNTRPVISGNLIRDGTGAGLIVTDSACPTIENNDICGHHLDGIVISDGADPTISDNRIYECKTTGVLVKAAGRGTLLNNDIRANAISGIVVQDRASPVIRGNKIRDGQGKGVDMYEGAVGLLDSNEVSNNIMDGIILKTGANPTIVNNKVFGNKGNGMYIFEGGMGVLEGNDVYENESSGVAIRSKGNPTLRRNKVHHGRKNGVYVYLNGLGELEGNEIYENRMDGVSVKSGGNPTVTSNMIRDCRGKGIFVHEKGLGTFDGNDVVGNSSTGVTVATGGDPTLRRNKVTDNKGHGVCVDKAQGLFENNMVSGNSGDGVHVRNGGTPEVRGNEITASEGHGLHICRAAAGVYDGNQVHANRKDGVTIRGAENPTVTQNIIYGNGGQALNMCDGGTSTCEGNDLG
eukprot:CAMPEP_0177715718 /NCGR_PEP_ID=MMETSP0484_2-20121128/14141_1 /TAXON_ID=354590 /ORGANISM="Rhodomonas lens, Strain RHODO" /LENGTH=770 /DNA_ID=CAMNT_0019227731 /DNA_START=71 /DNA_END=2383 /DNA_ORIENTATION=+